jgi:hypothetical protein
MKFVELEGLVTLTWFRMITAQPVELRAALTNAQRPTLDNFNALPASKIFGKPLNNVSDVEKLANLLAQGTLQRLNGSVIEFEELPAIDLSVMIDSTVIKEAGQLAIINQLTQHSLLPLEPLFPAADNHKIKQKLQHLLEVCKPWRKVKTDALQIKIKYPDQLYVSHLADKVLLLLNQLTTAYLASTDATFDVDLKPLQKWAAQLQTALEIQQQFDDLDTYITMLRQHEQLMSYRSVISHVKKLLHFIHEFKQTMDPEYHQQLLQQAIAIQRQLPQFKEPLQSSLRRTKSATRGLSELVLQAIEKQDEASASNNQGTDKFLQSFSKTLSAKPNSHQSAENTNPEPFVEPQADCISVFNL